MHYTPTHTLTHRLVCVCVCVCVAADRKNTQRQISSTHNNQRFSLRLDFVLSLFLRKTSSFFFAPNDYDCPSTSPCSQNSFGHSQRPASQSSSGVMWPCGGYTTAATLLDCWHVFCRFFFFRSRIFCLNFFCVCVVVFGRVLLYKHPVVRRSQRGQRAADRRVGTCEFPPRWGRGRGLNVAQMWLFLGGRHRCCCCVFVRLCWLWDGGTSLWRPETFSGRATFVWWRLNFSSVTLALFFSTWCLQ